jgi:ABC-type nitrate/sulfonate/bicarbonate transport system ATPase subunit
MAISMRHITVVLTGQSIIKDFSLDLPERGIMGISGPSGCGKTTLLHTLAGLIHPSSGSIEGIAQQRVGLVFQEDRLLPWLTAAENLNLIFKDQNRVLVWLDRMKLKSYANQYPHQLSGGMKRRVALARALAFDCDLLLLDEPFQGMDDDLKNQLYPWIKREGKKKPVVLVTHDRNELDALCDRTWRVDGPPVQLFSETW